jgi:hypothetical protein
MRWVGYTAGLGEKHNVKWLWLENMRERDCFEDLGADGRIVLKCI